MTTSQRSSLYPSSHVRRRAGGWNLYDQINKSQRLQRATQLPLLSKQAKENDCPPSQGWPQSWSKNWFGFLLSNFFLLLTLHVVAGSISNLGLIRVQISLRNQTHDKKNGELNLAHNNHDGYIHVLCTALIGFPGLSMKSTSDTPPKDWIR